MVVNYASPSFQGRVPYPYADPYFSGFLAAYGPQAMVCFVEYIVFLCYRSVVTILPLLSYIISTSKCIKVDISNLQKGVGVYSLTVLCQRECGQLFIFNVVRIVPDCTY